MPADTKRKSRHRPRLDPRPGILASARSLFVERPFDEVRVDDVAAAAGVAKGVIYYYFDSKRDLFEAVFREAADLLVARLQAIKDQEPHRPPIRRLSDGLDEIFTWTDEFEDLAALAADGTGVDRGIFAITEGLWEAIMNMLLDAVGEDAVRRGSPPPPRSLARQYAIRGWIHLVKSFADTRHSQRDVSVETLRTMAMTLFVDALAVADAAETSGH